MSACVPFLLPRDVSRNGSSAPRRRDVLRTLLTPGAVRPHLCEVVAMFVLNWLRRLFARLSPSRPRGGRDARPAGRRLGVEWLEERRVPATVGTAPDRVGVFRGDG